MDEKKKTQEKTPHHKKDTVFGKIIVHFCSSLCYDIIKPNGKNRKYNDRNQGPFQIPANIRCPEWFIQYFTISPGFFFPYVKNQVKCTRGNYIQGEQNNSEKNDEKLEIVDHDKIFIGH